MGASSAKAKITAGASYHDKKDVGMRSRVLPVLAAAALATGCARCGRPPEPPPERWLPAATGAALVPRLGDAAAELGGLLQALVAIPAASGIAEPYAALKQQLGLDPLDPAGLAAAGLDPDRGAGLSGEAQALAVLPVADAARLDALLARLARDRLGAGIRTEERQSAASLVVFRQAAGGPAALCYALVQRTALLSAGPGSPALVAAAVARPAPASLGADPTFARARQALGDGVSILTYAPPASPALAEARFLRDGAALGIRTGARGLELRLAILLSAERDEVWREVAGGEGAAAAGKGELARLPADAFAALRFGGDPAALGRRLSYAVDGRAAAALRAAGFDLRQDLFDLLAPGAAVGLTLAPTFQVAAVARGPSWAAGAEDPFRLVHLSAVARVRDPARLRAALDRVAAAKAPGAPKGPRPLTVRPRPDGTPGWRLAEGASALDLALSGDLLLVGGGAGRLDALLAAPGGWKPPTPGAAAALAAGGVGAALDFGALVKAVRALPPEAFGTGPDGFVMRALADRFLDPASRLSAGAASLRVGAGVARVDLSIEAAAP
jgi:hypothetical protein